MLAPFLLQSSIVRNASADNLGERWDISMHHSVHSGSSGTAEAPPQALRFATLDFAGHLKLLAIDHL